MVIGVFILCFYKQLMFSLGSSVLLGSTMGLALFFLWLLVNHTTALLLVIIALSGVLLMWTFRG